MFELWKHDPNSWNIDSNGQYSGPSLIRLVSRHRKPARALQALDRQRSRGYAVIDENRQIVNRQALVEMVG